MAEQKTFHLPDLGEGLPDATIVEWLVKEGDSVKLDAPLISMETAKAVVEVPSPVTGKLLRQHGKAGDVIVTGAPLADFELDPKGKQRADNAAAHHHHAPAPAAAAPAAAAPATGGERADEGTVVGAVQSSNEVRSEAVASVGGVKAVPAVRAMAKKLKVDLTRVTPSGAGGVVTLQDVKNAAAAGTATVSPPAGGENLAGTQRPVAPAPAPGAAHQADKEPEQPTDHVAGAAAVFVCIPRQATEQGKHQQTQAQAAEAEQREAGGGREQAPVIGVPRFGGHGLRCQFHTRFFQACWQATCSVSRVRSRFRAWGHWV